MDIMKERWVLEHGCIWTERGEKWTSPYNRDVSFENRRRFVLPNVGTKLGQHIIELHNKSLPEEKDPDYAS